MADPAPATLSVDSKVISCTKCRRPFEGVTMIDVGDIKRLRFGSALIYDLRMACIHCGAMFHWHESEKKMEEDSQKLLEIIGLLHAKK